MKVGTMTILVGMILSRLFTRLCLINSNKKAHFILSKKECFFKLQHLLLCVC